MNPPPTSIDGTDITGATIDGTKVQEITVDGDTVFIAGPPDTALDHRWPHSGGTDLTDAIGSLDGSLNGSSFQSDANAVDDTVLFHNGSSDFVSFGSGVFDFVAGGSFTATGYVNIDNFGSTQTILGQDTGGGQFSVFVTPGGNLRGQIQENNTFSSLTFNTGQWHFWAVRLNASTDTLLGRIDDTEETISTTSTAATSNGDARIADNGEGKFFLDGRTDETTLSSGLVSDENLDKLKARRDDFN